MSGGPPSTPIPPTPPSSRPISPPIHPAFLLPESLRGMAKTPQYQNAVRQYEMSHAAAATKGTPAAVQQQQPQPQPITPSTKPQFRVKEEPLSPSPQREIRGSATRITYTREETPQTPSPCTYSNGPGFNGLGGFFIIYGFTPARIDPNTGLVVNSLTAPLPPGSQLAYVPPGSPHPLLSPVMSPMMNPMMVPTGLHQIVQAAAQVQQRQLHEQNVQQLRQLQRQQMEQMMMQQKQRQSPPTATAIITPTASVNPIVLPKESGTVGMGSKLFTSPRETGMTGKHKTMATKETVNEDEGRNNGYDAEIDDDAASECSSYTTHSSDSDSELSSICSSTVDVEGVNTEQDKEGGKSKTKEEEIFAPPSFVSDHPLATSSPIKWNRVIKKEPNLDSTIGEDEGRMRNSMTTSIVDEGLKGGGGRGMLMKKEEPFLPSESPRCPEESGETDNCVTPPQSSQDLPQPLMTTPLARNAMSEEPPRRGSRRKAVSRLRKASESLEDQSELCLRDVAKVDYAEKKSSKWGPPSRGSARLAAARTISKSVEAEDCEDATDELARISATVKRSTEGDVNVEDGDIGTTPAKKMKQEILKFYVQHVIVECVADEEMFDSRNPMVEMELEKFDNIIRKNMEDQSDSSPVSVLL